MLLLHDVNTHLFINNALLSCNGPWCDLPGRKLPQQTGSEASLQPARLTQPDLVGMLCRKCLLCHRLKNWNVCASIAVSLARNLSHFLYYFSFSASAPFFLVPWHLPSSVWYYTNDFTSVYSGRQALSMRKIHHDLTKYTIKKIRIHPTCWELIIGRWRH